MNISIINHTRGKLRDEDVLDVIRVLNRQVKEDFEPYWSMGATLRLEGMAGKRIRRQDPSDMRGDAIIYLRDRANVDDALGYHHRNNRGIPFGFVFTDLAEEMEENWSATLSHEVLELIADPEVNLLVAGPHPKKKRQEVFHWFEMCDAVQDETYFIDGVEVSNFVLPLYFTGGEEKGGRNDFLGRIHNKKTLSSFGINPGGYIGFFNPKTGKHETYSLDEDDRAKKRMKIKNTAAAARRAIRYKRNHSKRKQY